MYPHRLMFEYLISSWWRCFGIVGPLGREGYEEEVAHCGASLKAYSVILLLALSLLPDFQ